MGCMTRSMENTTTSFTYPFPARRGSGTDSALCPYCGRPDAEPFEIVSRHRTSTGQTVWTRCACGSLQMRVYDRAGGSVVARGR